MEKMYVVQFEVYFTEGTTVEQVEQTIDPVADVCPFPITVRNDYGEVQVREVHFVDNLQEFDPDVFRKAVSKMLANNSTKSNPPCISIMGAYYWEMNVDDPAWNKTFSARSG
ncbi:MAG: hypothetical protein M0R06_25615 [Sphaerochaeta sp.]|jgi:hypothetical protein|nr:hypothetical protein [Sphaerochaeta sp.]